MPPRIESLSNHRIGFGDPLPQIFIRGSGFTSTSAVQIGDTWVDEFIVDGDEIITVTVPHLTVGLSYWVVVYAGDEASPCESESQRLSVDDLTDVPPGDLTLDSIEPPTIVVGRREPYWLLGTGLSQVRYAVIGSTPCPVESYDDNRLIVYVPDGCDGVEDGMSVVLEVFSPTERKSLEIECHGPLPDTPEPEEGWPGIFGIEPDRLGVDGGQVVVSGYRLNRVVTMLVGTIECVVDETSAEWVRATVPSLAGHEGQQLEITVADGEWASPENSVRLTVDA